MRTDIHRPSVVTPEDYEFVSHDYVGPDPFQGPLVLGERQAFRAHMTRTGGRFSGHEHGGTCSVCGATAFYLARFYHKPTNSYIATGEDCAEKMHIGNPVLFRTFREKVKAGLQAHAGKQKAKLILEGAGLAAAWEIYTGPTGRDGPLPYEENTICDICAKLVQYGSLSDKQLAFLRKLLAQIPERQARDAKRAAEAATAEPVPVTDKRFTVEGDVLSKKVVDTAFGSTLKMLVKSDAGFKLWGTVPGNLDVEKGDRVRFTARVEPSKDDPKFGFFSRPTQAVNLTARAEREAEKRADAAHDAGR